jgi:hypothetical protein
MMDFDVDMYSSQSSTDRSGGNERNIDRIESLKAAMISAVGGSIGNIPIALFPGA